MLDYVTRPIITQQQEQEKVQSVTPSQDCVVFTNKMMTAVAWVSIQ